MGKHLASNRFQRTPRAALLETRVGGNRQIFALGAGKQPTNCSLNTSGPPFSKQFQNRFIIALTSFSASQLLLRPHRRTISLRLNFYTKYLPLLVQLSNKTMLLRYLIVVLKLSRNRPIYECRSISGLL